MNPLPNISKLDEIVEWMALCIGESKDERRDDTSQIFDEMKTAFNQLLLEARISQIERVLPEYRHDLYGLVHTLEKDLAHLKQQLKNKEK